MTVEITGYAFVDRELHLFAINNEDYHLQQIERHRFDDGFEKELEFVFTKDSIDYLYKWLRRQKAVKIAHPQNLKDAVHLTLGTLTTISGKYLELA